MAPPSPSRLGQPVAGPGYDSLATPLAFGLALLIVVASIGHISGAHVNPAVTLGLAATGRFPWRYVPAYLAAQLAGAVLGALATWATFGDPGRVDANLAVTIPGAETHTSRGSATIPGHDARPARPGPTPGAHFEATLLVTRPWGRVAAPK